MCGDCWLSMRFLGRWKLLADRSVLAIAFYKLNWKVVFHIIYILANLLG